MSVEATMAYDWNVFGEPFRDRTNDLRAGVLSIAYGGAEYGISSEGIRHATQNVAIHDHFLDWFGEPSPWFNGLPRGHLKNTEGVLIHEPRAFDNSVSGGLIDNFGARILARNQHGLPRRTVGSS